MFLRIRQTWFPVDSIDQIDDIGGRLRVHLSTGVKIDLDPIESEKVSARIESLAGQSSSKALAAPASPAVLAKVAGLEGALSALEDRVDSLREELDKERAAKAKVKTHA